MSKWGEGIIIALLAAIFYLLLPASEKQTFDNIALVLSCIVIAAAVLFGCLWWYSSHQASKEPAKPMRTPAEQAEYDRNMATALALNRRKWK